MQTDRGQEEETDRNRDLSKPLEADKPHDLERLGSYCPGWCWLRCPSDLSFAGGVEGVPPTKHSPCWKKLPGEVRVQEPTVASDPQNLLSAVLPMIDRRTPAPVTLHSR
jgi:hypothetical protein